MIPQCNPGASYRNNRAAIDRAVLNVLEGGWYILGKQVELFEREFAEYCRCKNAVGTANGTDSIEIILRALGIGNGALVATTANTAAATVAAIERAGAEPRFADIDPETRCMSPDSLKRLLAKEPGIKAVVPVHLFGIPAPMPEILDVAGGLPVIEDCAQAHGARIGTQFCGTFGIAGSFSFYPTKNLGAFGDGGCVITNHSVLAEKIRVLRQYGWENRYISSFPGINSRLDEMQAAILRVKLTDLETDNRRRREIAEFYTENLQGLPLTLPAVPRSSTPVFHQYVIETDSRDELASFLKTREIGTAVHYPIPLHLQPAYQKIPRPVPLENTESVNRRILSLPMFPALSERDCLEIVKGVGDFFHV